MAIDPTAYTSPIGNILQDHELLKDIGAVVAAIDIRRVFDLPSVNNRRVTHLASVLTKIVQQYQL